jgi:hypothetical protein
MLVLLMGGTYDMHHQDGFMWHDTHTYIHTHTHTHTQTKFHEDWHRHSSNIKV